MSSAPRHPISLAAISAPWLSFDELAPLAAAAGYLGIDLVTKPHHFDSAKSPAFWDNNAAIIDLERLEHLVPQAARVLGEWRLQCPMLGSYTFAEDVDTARRLAKAARVLGAPLVRMWVPRPERGRMMRQIAEQRRAWDELARIGAETGVRFVMETHPNTLAVSATGALHLLEGIDPKRVGVVLDVANTVREGLEPLDIAVELLGPYLAHVQVKDVWRRSGGANWDGSAVGFASLGEGSLRWPTIIGILKAGSWYGWMAIESFAGIEYGPARISRDITWLKDQMELAGNTAQYVAIRTTKL